MNVNEAVRIHLASVQAGHADFDDTLKLINQYFEFRKLQVLEVRIY